MTMNLTEGPYKDHTITERVRGSGSLKIKNASGEIVITYEMLRYLAERGALEPAMPNKK